MTNALARAALFLLVACYSFGAQAQQVGQGIVCDTQDLAERFVAFADSGDIPNAISEINLEAKYDTACMMMQIVFFPGSEVKNLPSKGGTVRIMEVIMVGMRTARGFVRTLPTSQFILALEPSQGA